MKISNKYRGYGTLGPGVEGTGTFEGGAEDLGPLATRVDGTDRLEALEGAGVAGGSLTNCSGGLDAEIEDDTLGTGAATARGATGRGS